MKLQNMKRSETTEQIALFNWAKRTEDILPEIALMYHVPNEGKRTNGEILKAAGLKKGVPDICLPVPTETYHGLYIEMKFDKNKPTKEQLAYMELLRQQNYKTAVCYSAEEAREEILNYLSKQGYRPMKECVQAPWIDGRCDGVHYPGSKFSRTECFYCEQHEPDKEEKLVKENLKSVTDRRFALSIEAAIYYIANGNMTINDTLEDALETINKNLALLVRADELTVDKSAAVLDAAMKAYQEAKKRKGE